MQIFCIDLMLTEISLKNGRGPGFLIHDSHLFDGVDERQVAKALQLGAERAETVGFQYIVTMNSDALPRAAFKAGFNIRSYVMDTKLTDATDTGGCPAYGLSRPAHAIGSIHPPVLIAAVEKQAHMYLSTLRSCVEAIGGKLELKVQLPEQPPPYLNGLGDLEATTNGSERAVIRRRRQVMAS